MPGPEAVPSGSCPSCGTALLGSYCHVCGERDAAERELSLRAFLREHLRTFGELRGKGLRSFGALVLAPGALTREYMRGRRVRYLHPLQLFLLANLLFFLSLSITSVSGLSTPLRQQLEGQVYSELARDLVRGRFVEMDSVAFAPFEARYDYAAEVQAKTLVIVLVPLFAVAIFGTRFWRRETGVQHLVFSTHFVAFVMLLLIVLGILTRGLAALPDDWTRWLSVENVITSLFMIIAAGYLYAALRRAYGDRAGAAALRAPVLSVLFIILLLLYRFLLHITVLYTT